MALIDDTQDMVFIHRVFTEAFGNADRYVTEEKFEVATRYYQAVLNFLLQHHGAEDEILWPRLIERSAIDAERVKMGVAQHESINAALYKLCDQLAAWKAGPSETHAALFREALKSTAPIVAEHLQYEESVLLPICEANIEVEEWRQLPGYALRGLSGEDLMMTLGLVMEQFNEKFLNIMNTNMPAPLKAAYYPQGEQLVRSTLDALRA